MLAQAGDVGCRVHDKMIMYVDPEQRAGTEAAFDAPLWMLSGQ
jgi:hypothetical protein